VAYSLFKYNFIYVMLKCQVCARGLFSRDRGESEAFEISTEARPSRDTTKPRDRGVKTEATALVSTDRSERVRYRNTRICVSLRLNYF